MLVFLILFINTAQLCQGKALLEETESNRGKRSYSHLPNIGFHQTYDPQSNAEHWMKGNFYEPEVDGQPIYVPAVDQPGSYNEFLDAYYKAYTPASSLATPVPYTYDTKIKKTQTLRTSDKKDSFKNALPTSKETEFSVEMSSSDDSDLESVYDDPDIVDKIIAIEFNDEKPDMASELEEQEIFEEPVIRESLKKSKLPKPKDHDQYDTPIVVKTVKQKTKSNNAKQNPYKSLDTSKSTYKNKITIKDAFEEDNVKNVSPVSKYHEFSVETSTSDSDLDSEDYNPEVIDKTVETEFSNENSDTSELEDKFDEPVVRGSLKKSGFTKSEDNGKYDIPIVKKAVKQKQKADNSKKNLHKNPSESENTYENTEKAKGYHEKDSVKYESQSSKQSELSVEMNTEDYDLKSQDYDDPKVVDETIGTKTNEELDMKSDLTIEDEINESVLRESLKESEQSKTNSKDDDQYISVDKSKQKPKPTNLKISTPITKPQLESIYEQTEIKVKPDKKIKPSAQKYDQTSKGTLKKPKGKRRKQNFRTGGAVDKKPILYSNTVKPDSVELYTQTDKQKKVSTKKPVKTEEKLVTKQNSKYEFVTKASMTTKSSSKYKPTVTDKNSKPISNKEKVVKTGSLYQSIKSKENVTLRSDKPEQENLNTGEFEKEDILIRKLNNLDSDLFESDRNTDNSDSEKQESDLGNSMDISDIEFSEKLNSESIANEGDLNLESANSGDSKPESIVSNIDFRALSSMNSNIWSMLFNPNAEQNKLKLKRCITRSNETGFCTYIQNCEVPHIATSLEQLLNNACVIDDIFIGVCCPEFPVQTVKVHWDKTSDFDNTIEDEFGHIAEDCGIRSNEASELQSWPWKAPLVSMSNGKIFCGGAVVSEDHVLTAAHCTTKIPKNQILVRLGQYNDESGDDYAVVEIKRHAQYNPRTMQNDIALLKLGRRIMNDVHIGIVCLPDEDNENNHNGEIATLLGWRGIFGTKSKDPEFLRIISNKECENKLGMKVPGTSLCTETRKENERTCNADSGAPLVIEDEGRYEVIGILSWNRNDCDQRFPSTFSRVSSYTGWIRNHIG